MEFPVIYQGKAVGTCEAEDQGLYWLLRCRCDLRSDRVERLYCGVQRLGVLERQGETLTMSRRLSKRTVPDFPPEDGRLFLEPSMTPWQGTVLDCRLPEGYQKREGDRLLLLFPFAWDRPFPCMPLFCFFTRQGPYWVLTLDAAGQPVFSSQ